MAEAYAATTHQAPEAAAGPRSTSELRSARVTACLVAAVLVLVLGVAAILTTRMTGLVAALWGAGGVAVAGWLRGPRSTEFDAAYALFITVAFATANVLVGNSLTQTAMFTVANMLEVATAVFLARRVAPQGFDLSSLNGLARYLLAVPLVSPLPGALLAGAGLAAAGLGEFRHSVETWWFGHALGLAVVGTVGLSVTSERLQEWRRPRRLLEAAAILLGMAVVTAVAFLQSKFAIGFLITPMLLLAAVRLRLFGAASAILIVALGAIAGVMLETGPVVLGAFSMVETKLRVTQLYVLLGCVPILLVAALLDERDRLAAAAQAGQLRAEAASAAKSRLLANVSHEIKSPVAGVIGIGELWASGQLGPVSPTQAEMSEMLVRTARQVEALANDLLDVARAEAGRVAVTLRSVDLDGLAEDVRRAVAVRPESAGLRFVVEPAQDRLVALADSVRLSQVVTNLATNAVKYGRSGGVVIFRLSRPDAETARIEVIDRGPGISLEKQTELFEPFNRLGMEKSEIEGHGIGLALARRLAELQGGRIGFESRPGDGARFWVDLPAAQA
ncbi:HAMP domain-containing sensor histidine kinase [Caulobacter sp. 17J80-11]|uniref:sensor histidine kinase n=1 Tax=Caulobacter sp. 17J80-11 TaxID=2763502 RepID=UPI001653B09E|nr:HAMP domain-containing sensor histidine kinase [Caulobacter sp. 17J80-11]MBC6980272.1 MASE1 domain-containing protein [Caulobacter sp. 17J80-11]